MDNPAHKPLGWGLAVQLAAREMRDGLAGFRIFLMCLILGISTIAAVGSLSASLVGGMAAQGQAILGGDIDFRLVHRAAFKQERDWLDRQGSVSEIATLRAMIRYGDEAMLAEVKSVDAAYPLYGAVKTAPDTPLSVLSAEPETTGAGGDIYPAMAEKGLFDRLQLAVGDVVSIGDIRLRLMAELAHEPDRTAAGFPLAPRLLVAHATLRAAGLLQPGSLVNFHYRIKLADTASVAEVKAVSAGAAETFPNAGWRIRDRSDASPSLRRFIERLGLFLTLVGLTALVVGGVGVGNAITAYIEKRRESIAVMKALGASGRFVFRIYAAQIAALTLVATGIGLSIGAATPWLLQALAGALLPVELQMALFPRPLLAAAGFGILAAAAFALWPLGRAEKMPVTGLFRNDAPQAAHCPSMFYLAAIGVCFAGLLALALVISERRDVALWFGVGVGLSYLALRLTAGAIVLLAEKTAALVSDGRPALRLALANITRPNAPVRAVVLSIGLSVALLSAISMVDGNINRQIQGDLPERTPSFFFLDIQPTQIDQFLSASEAFGGIGDVETLPMLRGQIMAINDTLSRDLSPPPEAAWILRGDRGLTYAVDRPESGKLVEGEWWPADYTGPPLISFDAEIARAYGIGIGDRIRVNVLGRPLTGEIANLRHVDWESGGMNFVMVFSPHPLKNAPHSFLASMSMAEDREPAFARMVARDYPNVTIIRVKEAMETFAGILNNLGLAVRAMSGITLLAGILVLAGAMATGHRARVYDAVVMKVLGATRRRILLAYILEYALMGLAAALIAAAVGTLASWGLVAGAMQANWVFLPVTLGLTIFGSVSLTIILGLLGTFKALGAAAAPVLRAQ